MVFAALSKNVCMKEAAAPQEQKAALHIMKDMKLTLIGVVYENVFTFLLLLIDSVLLPYPLK